MYFSQRSRHQFLELGDASRLCAGLVVRKHAACRQDQRVLFVSFLGWWLVRYAMKPRTSARCRKSDDEQPGCSWMVRLRARPEEAVFGLCPLVGHGGIVG